MPSNGYFDEINNTLFARSVESWADYTNWSTLTSWGGTPSSLLEFTTNIIDAGILDWHLPLLTFDSGAPVTITVEYGETVDSTGGAIDSPSTTTISPDTAEVPGIYARFFKFTLTQGTGDSAGAEDSAGSPLLFLSNFNVGFHNETLPLSQSDIDTSTLGGSVGARELTFVKETGKITNCIAQPHITGLDDSGGDPVRPIIYIDKTSTPLVLNIFDADSYGKARRIDCTVDVQIQYLPICFSSANGQTEVVIN